MHDLDALKSALLHNSIRFGDFKSGDHTDVYVDAKLTTCSAEAMKLVGRVFLRKIQECGWAPKAVGGLTVGADPISFSISQESVDGAGTAINAFIVRKEPKKHGMQRFIEGLENTQDLPVVVIDDVCTSGWSTAEAIEKALEARMQILGAICLVDREMGAEELIGERFGVELDRIFTLSDLRRHRDAAVHE